MFPRLSVTLVTVAAMLSTRTLPKLIRRIFPSVTGFVNVYVMVAEEVEALPVCTRLKFVVVAPGVSATVAYEVVLVTLLGFDQAVPKDTGTLVPSSARKVG